MGCGSSAVSVEEFDSESLESALRTGALGRAQQIAAAAVLSYPPSVQRVGAVTTAAAWCPLQDGTPTAPNGTATSGNPLTVVPGDDDTLRAGAEPRPDTVSAAPPFHASLQLVQLRCHLGAVYIKHGRAAEAETHYRSAQRGAQQLRGYAANDNQNFLAKEAWVNATIGVCQTALHVAPESSVRATSEEHCARVLALCAEMRPVALSIAGRATLAMATIYEIEAKAHAMQKHYRSALVRAQRALGTLSSNVVEGSARRQRLQQLVAEYTRSLDSSRAAAFTERQRDSQPLRLLSITESMSDDDAPDVSGPLGDEGESRD